MMTQVVLTKPGCRLLIPTSDDLDRDIRRIRDQVVDSRSLLRLGDDCPDLIQGRIGVDGVGHFDAIKTITHVTVDAKNPLDVHAALERRRDGVELDLAILSDGSDTRSQTAGQTDEHEFDRCRAVVLGRENLRMIRIDREFALVMMLLAETEESLDGGATVSAVDLPARRPPSELGCLRRLGQRLARA